MAMRPSMPKPDRVFVIRLWIEERETRSSWFTEVKEIGSLPHGDRRRVVNNLSTAFDLIRLWLEQAPKTGK